MAWPICPACGRGDAMRRQDSGWEVDSAVSITLLGPESLLRIHVKGPVHVRKYACLACGNAMETLEVVSKEKGAKKRFQPSRASDCCPSNNPPIPDTRKKVG